MSNDPLSAAQLFERLDAMGISHRTVEHAPLFTVEQSRRLRGDLAGAHVKNLFLKNKKGQMWLLTCLEHRRFDLKALRARLGTSSLSFCSEERLFRYLGVIPGAVTPFAVINDVDCAVEVVLDDALRHENPLNFHPLDNRKTTAIVYDDLIKFLQRTKHPPMFLDFHD